MKPAAERAGNPAVQGALNCNSEKDLPSLPFGIEAFCRAAEPIESMYADAFRHHIRENGARLLKFDNLCTVCQNTSHAHLPGVYSTEPIENAVSEFFHELDAECRDVFLMGYWGYRSPWRLLHADALFDSGMGIEASSPSDQPNVSAIPASSSAIRTRTNPTATVARTENGHSWR